MPRFLIYPEPAPTDMCLGFTLQLAWLIPPPSIELSSYLCNANTAYLHLRKCPTYSLCRTTLPLNHAVPACLVYIFVMLSLGA